MPQKKPGKNPWLVKNDYGGLGRDMERCTFDRPLFGAGWIFVSKHLRNKVCPNGYIEVDKNDSYP